MLREKLQNIINNYDESHQFIGFQFDRLPIYLAVGPGLCLALLVPTEGDVSPGYKSNLVSLKLSIKCSISIEGETIESKKFDILQCESTEPAHVETFILLCQAFVSSLTELPNSHDAIYQFFDSLLTLFRAQPASNLFKERQGLWGELFVMYSMGKTKEMISYWHKESTRKFDFSSGNKRIEVKTTTGINRVHAFSHQQLYSNSGHEIAIASIMLRPEEAGLSLKGLIDAARQEVASDFENLKKLERAIKSAGMDDPLVTGPVYDKEEALENIAWFFAKNVPKFPFPEPVGVSGARYNVVLSLSPQIAGDELDTFINGFLNT
ncbi:PD-(D/E)XK motif protein [Candidatus Contubernalis alkaliaceticus]|uniref:PD-(D/E)XK motif protein n=1 Tax=Candidatus Contubernalis alkaliaceticus TaxID=338645 RepID=UPI001F4C4387|nr:PD-(D/E)XK motif protein [Candidatus Contubernalis alkalaceticus]UNC91286.1 PD-(D/E)XK motif protein [Candidatus Contubernalis alkalaceticus]